MKITGELLKAERLRQGIAVADIASSLKLSSRIITSIESGDIKELPAKTFIRGFVKSYAQFLKLDADLILRQFLEEMGSTQPLPKVPPPQATTLDGRPKIPRASTASSEPPKNLSLNYDNTKKTIFYISIASALLAVILVVNNVVEKYQKAAVVDKKDVDQVQPLKSAENVLAPIDLPPPSVPGVTTSNTNTAPVDVSPATTIDNKSNSESSAVSDINVVTSAPSDFEPSSGKPIELIVVAKKETEFFYAKGNTKNFVRVKLAPKEVQIIRSLSGLHLKTDDGSAVSLILNGVEKGQASSSNKPIRLTF